jgi:glycerol-3-phosphate dehydrogenase
MSRRIDLAELAPRYDLVIVGGGITGAGVLREAVRTGARVLLVEQRDFAAGTSSYSSKLVHGGLRYLKTGQWRLTLESVRERRRLLREAPGLVEPQPFLVPLYRGRKPGRLLMQTGLLIYDLMAGRRQSRFLNPEQLLAAEPGIARADLIGAVAYEDAWTDDARLVMALILESIAQGAQALNYVRADPDEPGVVRLCDLESGTEREVRCDMVIQATGAWAAGGPGAPALRPLRGSHFVFPASALPVRSAVSWLHPWDGRPVFAYPWLGAVLYGTTDLDHQGECDAARMSTEESEYLLAGLRQQFPDLELRAGHALSTYAGVRPVVSSGRGNPSAESRESAMWRGPGMVGITGGKLTTFRVTAMQVLREAARQVPRLRPRNEGVLFTSAVRRPAGEPIAGTPFSWEGLRQAARDEYVVRLEDLLLRRTRLGLITPRGGEDILPRVREICMDELHWDQVRWDREAAAYRQVWRHRHAPPPA